MRSRVIDAIRDDWRIGVAAVLGLGLLAALVTVVVVLVSRPASQSEAAEGASPAADSPLQTARPLPKVQLDDFRVPNEGRRLENWWWQRYRTPGEPWSDEQVERFWEDPVEAGIDYLAPRNDKEIERILENVP